MKIRQTHAHRTRTLSPGSTPRSISGTVRVLIRWQGYDESERTWEPLTQVYEDVPVITEKYVEEVDDPTLTEALDRVIEDDLPDLVEVSSSESSDEDSSDKDSSSDSDDE